MKEMASDLAYDAAAYHSGRRVALKGLRSNGCVLAVPAKAADTCARHLAEGELLLERYADAYQRAWAAGPIGRFVVAQKLWSSCWRRTTLSFEAPPKPGDPAQPYAVFCNYDMTDEEALALVQETERVTANEESVQIVPNLETVAVYALTYRRLRDNFDDRPRGVST